MFVGGKTTKRFYAENGEMITSLDIPLPQKARFVRISAYDKLNYKSVSRTERTKASGVAGNNISKLVN